MSKIREVAPKSETFKNLRKAAGFKRQADVARFFGVSKNSANAWDNDRVVPDDAVLMALNYLVEGGEMSKLHI